MYRHAFVFKTLCSCGSAEGLTIALTAMSTREERSMRIVREHKHDMRDGYLFARQFEEERSY